QTRQLAELESLREIVMDMEIEDAQKAFLLLQVHDREVKLTGTAVPNIQLLHARNQAEEMPHYVMTIEVAPDSPERVREIENSLKAATEQQPGYVLPPETKLLPGTAFDGMT